jgi:hypothetical protein
VYQNNFYFHNSTARFDASVNPVSYGAMPMQMMQSGYPGMGEHIHQQWD